VPPLHIVNFKNKKNKLDLIWKKKNRHI
jgi:hypothetical protein